MKKTLITILIILILGGLGYFAYTNTSQNKTIENESIINTYPEFNIQNTDTVIPADDQIPVTEKKEVGDAKAQNQTPPKTNTTTTYMCEGRVKIVRVQDSPSLPPRVSYLRVSDNASIASYGDFGAYIQPEYFSIDRKKIEEGYTFNETNFCKYLKS